MNDPTQGEGERGRHLRLVKRDQSLLDEIMNMTPLKSAQYSIEALKRIADRLELKQNPTKEDVSKALDEAQRALMITGYLMYDLATITKDL